MAEKLTELSREEIMEIIPHRPPILMLDSAIVVFGKRATAKMIDWTKIPEVGIQNFPRLLIIEPLAQAGAVSILGMPENKKKTPFLAGVEDFRFFGDFEPGQEVVLEAEMIKLRTRFGKGAVRAIVNGQIKASGIIVFALGDRPSNLGRE